MVPVLKLPFRFDAAALREDLARFAPDEWTPHFNTQYYEGDWSGIALRAASKAHVELYPDPTASVYADTAQMKRCTYIPAALDMLKCDLESVRFLRLAAGAEIREHRDFKLSVDDGVARMHVPIKTNPDVDFMLGGKRVAMLEGEVWYLNFNLPHSVRNKGNEDRVHLVIDCIANDWLCALFPVAP